MAGGGTVLGAGLLALSFVLGASTEVELSGSRDDGRRLTGDSAVAYDPVELVFDDDDSRPVLAGTKREVPLVVDPDAQEFVFEQEQEGFAQEPGLRLRLDDGRPVALEHQGYADPEAVRARRCAAVVSLASRTRSLREGQEDRAVEAACAAALAQDERLAGAVSEVDPDADPADAERRQQRALELFRGARGAGDLRPRVLSLEAAVVAGRRTRSDIEVRLLGPRGLPAPRGAVVRAAYPGGSVVGTTGGDGTALLPLPDVALSDPLPVVVSWRGSAPAGSRVGPFGVTTPQGGEFRQQGLQDYAWKGWLREDLPYALSVTVVREGL